MNSFRLIVDSPAAGVWNMAVDEALLESAADSGIATLRVYTWSEPTLSLGYFQAAADREQHPASRTCTLVRRASGGGAILHHHELTYSLALPDGDGRAATARRLYEACHQAWIAVLRELDITATMYGSNPACGVVDSPTAGEPFLCFQRRTCFDIVCQGAKIVGSAQRRRRGGILQHGSVLLARSPFAPELPGIRDLTAGTIAAAELSSSWPPRLAEAMDYRLQPGELSPRETENAEIHCRQRFAAKEFQDRR